MEDGGLVASLCDESRRNWRYTFSGGVGSLTLVAQRLAATGEVLSSCLVVSTSLNPQGVRLHFVFSRIDLELSSGISSFPHQMQKCSYGESLNTFLQREGVVACMDNIPFGRLQIFAGPVKSFGD